VLVGGSAWLSYAPITIVTEDMDFVVPRATSAVLHGAAMATVRRAAKVPAVCTALAVLEAISAEHRSEYGVDVTPAERMARVAAAEQVQFDPARDYSSFLQVRKTEMGWRIALGHRGLVDLAPMDDADTRFFVSKLGDGAAPTITSARLSAALPGKLATKYSAVVDPVLKVGLASLCLWMEWECTRLCGVCLKPVLVLVHFACLLRGCGEWCVCAFCVCAFCVRACV
jgi:hypothetical protein